MAKPPGQRRMETLSETLGRSTGKVAKRVTGKVVPVPKPKNPYITQINRSKAANPNSTFGPSPGVDYGFGTSGNLAAALGAAAQTKPKAAVSTEIEAQGYESDPILARIKAIGAQNVANAETEAAALRKQAILESGLGNVGAEIGVDASTVQAANENPFGKRQAIERTSVERGRALDEQLNQGNLFYSGHRINELGDLSRSTAEAQNSLSTELRKILGQIDSGVLNARTLAAEEEAEGILNLPPAPVAEVPAVPPLAGILGGEAGVPLDPTPYYQSPDYGAEMTPQEIALLLGLSLQGNLPY